MADVATTSVELQSSPKTTIKKEKKKSDRPKASHPSTAVMVNTAIQNLKERGGSSLQAIKKYISATYKIDGEKFAPFIRKYLKASVISGALVQTKGKGASGSFKLASTAVTKKAVSTTATKPRKATSKSTTKKSKPKAEKEVKSAAVASAKKSTVAKSKRSTTLEKKRTAASAKVAKPKSPSKAKKTTKTPTKKPKSPKPKTTKPKVVKKKASPKKK